MKRLLIASLLSQHANKAYPISAMPLPTRFDDKEPGLMTVREFFKWRNPEGKSHPEDAYRMNVEYMNPALRKLSDMTYYGTTWEIFTDAFKEPKGKYVVVKDGNTVAVVAKGTLYFGPGVRPNQIPTLFFEHGRPKFELEWSRERKVKYPEEYVPLVSSVAKRNLSEYNHLIQNLIVKGRSYQLRSEGVPKKNAGQTLAILNDKGEKVAYASNEWGATLITVAREYQRHGFGKLLGQHWYKINPSFGSGGFTPSGEENAQRIWEDRVLEFLSNGWYSKLVRSKKLSPQKVKEILDGLSQSAKRRSKLPDLAPAKKKGQVLVYADDPSSPTTFVVYNSNFLEDQDEKNILGYGFFRDSPDAPAPYLYTIDYDRPHDKLVNSIALQVARDNGEQIYVGEGYGDMLEYEGIPGVEQDGDVIELTRDLLPLSKLTRLEKAMRRKVDPYGELESTLLEMAESKWS